MLPSRIFLISDVQTILPILTYFIHNCTYFIIIRRLVAYLVVSQVVFVRNCFSFLLLVKSLFLMINQCFRRHLKSVIHLIPQYFYDLIFTLPKCIYPNQFYSIIALVKVYFRLSTYNQPIIVYFFKLFSKYSVFEIIILIQYGLSFSPLPIL